jgi:hypothetical protein
MSDLPQSIHIYEQGPREGFQFAKGLISRHTRVRRVTSAPKISCSCARKWAWIPGSISTA